MAEKIAQTTQRNNPSAIRRTFPAGLPCPVTTSTNNHAVDPAANSAAPMKNKANSLLERITADIEPPTVNPNIAQNAVDTIKKMLTIEKWSSLKERVVSVSTLRLADTTHQRADASRYADKDIIAMPTQKDS
jgi:hypothetical protein